MESVFARRSKSLICAGERCCCSEHSININMHIRAEMAHLNIYFNANVRPVKGGVIRFDKSAHTKRREKKNNRHLSDLKEM